MRCDEVQARLSARADGWLDGEGDGFGAHVARCERCARFAVGIAEVRRAVRYEVVDEPPDVAPGVLARVRGERRRRRSASPTGVRWVAASFAAAFLAGVVLVGVNPRQPALVQAADVPARVIEAQPALASLDARVEVVERGWSAAVPVRRYDGRLTYRAPESLALRLRDETSYPDERWVANHTITVSAADVWWASGLRSCPRESLPECLLPEPRVAALRGREPFDDGSPVALDLVLPVGSFRGAATPRDLGSASWEGRPTVGVVVTAGQAAPFVEGLTGIGAWREVHPTDEVELWLDAEWLVPLRVRILPAPTEDRRLWAARRGYPDPAGRPILELSLRQVRLNARVDDAAFPPPPEGATHRDAGFRPATPHGSAPRWLPDGMEPSRRGVVRTVKGPPLVVATWTDGRAWLKVKSTGGWRGDRLFGDLGEPVRAVDLGAAGVGYADVAGTRVALHGSEVDVVVTGSVPLEDLRRVAASLDVEGLPVLERWAESASGTLDDAAAALPGLLSVDLEGFGPPAVRIDGDSVTLVHAGPGARSLVVVQARGRVLAPPLDPDARGVTLRGSRARFSPRRGELEWVEDGLVVSMHGHGLGLDELLAAAERLEARHPPRGDGGSG